MDAHCPSGSRTLLCVANYPANTGYAWDFIEGIYAQVANRVAALGCRTFVAYPAIPEAPRSLVGSAALPFALDVGLETEASVCATEEFIRRERVEVLYLTDRPARSSTYMRLRRAGLKCIIVHDHTSGKWTRATGMMRAAKWAAARVPGHVADVVVTVSDYVARRQMDVGMIPVGRVKRIWNGLPVPEPDPGARDRIGQLLSGVNGARPIVACACRATPEKGVDHLLRAFDRYAATNRGEAPPILVYIGDGPAFGDLCALRDTLRSKKDIFFTGYQESAAALIEGADVCVVPSVWQEAFSLAVLEAMARARPVIGTTVGGIPELIEDRVTGLLVPPADESALALALQELLRNPELRSRLGLNARNRASEVFTPEAQTEALTELVAAGFQRQ